MASLTKAEKALRLLADWFAGSEANASHRELGAALHETLGVQSAPASDGEDPAPSGEGDSAS